MNPYIMSHYEMHFKQMLDEAVSKEPLYRHERIMAMEALGDERAVDFLISMLDNPESLLRIRAIGALGGINDRRACGPLRKLLEDRDSWVRLYAAMALARLGDEHAIPGLLDSLVNVNIYYRDKAVLGLKALGTEKALAALSKLLSTNPSGVSPWAVEEAQKAFAEAGESRYDKILIDILSSGTVNNDTKAIDRLGRSDDPAAVGVLIEALSGKGWGGIRANAAEGLARFRDPRAIKPLKDCIIVTAMDGSIMASTTGPAARGSCAWALGCIGDCSCLDFLLDMLNEKNTLTRSRVLRAVGRLGDARACEAMMEATRDGDSQVRENAIWGLGELGDARAIEVIKPFLDDKIGRLRAQSAWALARLGDYQSFDSILKLLKDADAHVRAWSARALGKFKDARAVQFLVDSLATNDQLVRAGVVWALGEIGNDSAMDIILKNISDASPSVRGEATRAITKNRFVKGIQALKALANDESGLYIWDEKNDYTWVTVRALAEDGLRIFKEGI